MKIIKFIKKYIEYKKRRIKTYGLLYTFVFDPWEDYVEIPILKIYKIIQWIPKLWNINDSEGTHLLKIMDYQLSRTQKVLKNDPVHYVDENCKIKLGPKLSKEVEETRKCINNILENNFCKREQKKLDKKYGTLKLIFNKSATLFDKNGKPLAYKAEFKPDGKIYRNSLKRIHNLEEKRKKEEYDKLFKILKEKLESWYT